MTKLNLTAKGTEQGLILAYLQENASDVLAEKINNGVIIEKDGQRVRNVKTLDTFMQYAESEARKLAEKDTRVACVKDATVYGWAIHYFEEESIIGKLYTLDGKELAPEPKKAKSNTASPARSAKKQEAQMSLFGMMEENTPTMSEAANEETDEDNEAEQDDLKEETDEDEPEKEQTPIPERQTQSTPFYQFYRKFATENPDTLLFMKVVDFYEALGDHAEKVANALDLTLTGRDCGLGERVPMCGVPHHAFELYVAKLLERGYKVAIAEDLKGYHFAGENNSRIDPETGEVFSAEPQTEQDGDDPIDDFDASAFDKEALCILSDLFGDDIDVR